MARRDAGTLPPGTLSDFRGALLARSSRLWASWGTPAMRAEHDEFTAALRAGEAVILSAHAVFGVLHEMDDDRADLFAWGGDGYGRDWHLSERDELTPATTDTDNSTT